MTTSIDDKTELALRLKISKKAAEKLAQHATETGRSVDDYASDLLEQAISSGVA
jgi:predicted HicB family RNase H-like nuclease